MEPSVSNENLMFDHHTIRLLIGGIAVSFPVVVLIAASQRIPSISWSYYTGARDLFVGFLFVIGAFLASYKGHKPTLSEDEVGKLWKWLGKYWKGAVKFRIWERENEEDWVSWSGGLAAGVTAVCPITVCVGTQCPYDPISTIHYISAVVLFSTTVYFCLVAFRGQANTKIKTGEGLSGSGIAPKQRRLRFYSFCGWGIVAIMLLSAIMALTELGTMLNIMFWAETVALVLFGIAWLVASHYIPFLADETEQRKLFWSSQKYNETD